MATTWLLHVHVSGSDMPAVFTVEIGCMMCRLCWGILLCSLYTCTSLASIGIHYSMLLKLLYMKQCTCTSHYRQEELNCLTSHWTSPLPASLHIEPVLCLLYFILKAVPQTFTYFTTISIYLHVFVFLFILWVHLILASCYCVSFALCKNFHRKKRSWKLDDKILQFCTLNK